MQPTTKPKITAHDFFIHTSLIAFLYVFVISFVNFLLDIINYAFPDRQDYYVDPYSSSMRLEVSIIIVVFPIVCWLIKTLQKTFIASPERKEVSLRKWFIYLTLFLTAITLAINLIVLINTFLGGEITNRFILKVIAIALVSGSLFYTCLQELRDKLFSDIKKMRMIMLATSVIILGSLISAFLIIGSPANMRNLKDDAKRVSDLQSIEYQVINHYQTVSKLPQNLSVLSDSSLQSFVVPKDPSTNADYEYSIIAATTSASATSKLPQFQLCATFVTNSDDVNKNGQNYSAPYPTTAIYPDQTQSYNNISWNHKNERTCFNKTIDPNLYPAFVKVPAAVTN